MRLLFIGDIVGRPGRQAVLRILPRWRAQYSPTFVLANAENAAGGTGLTPGIAEELLHAGIDALTLGNHTFNKKEIIQFLDTTDRVVRPANYPAGVPGHGHTILSAGDDKLAVINLLGRVFMDPVDDPFHQAATLVPLLREETSCILLDIHAEATSEKAALAWMLDGQVSAVVGTHTHVPTADARILPGGTAFITDVGMAGPWDSILGVRTDIIVQRFRTWMPARFEVAEGRSIVSAVLIDLHTLSGMAEQIMRIDEVVLPESMA
jgi:metallophosphoesterase (TIGR00282 family)